MIPCPCCGVPSESTGGTCHMCVSWIWCSCGAKFCAMHHGKYLEEHKCPSTQIIPTAIQPQPPFSIIQTFVEPAPVPYQVEG
jgi:hypothetical protein